MTTVKQIVLPVALVAVVAAVVAAFVAGLPGALGALLGGLVVVLFLGSTPAVLTPAVKAMPALSVGTAVGFFTTKAVAVVIVLLLLFDLGGVAEHVDATAFGLTAIVASLVWTVLQILLFRRERVPVYDLGNND